jgi:hypothetical protein
MKPGTDNEFILNFTGKVRYDTISNLINELKSKVVALGIQTTIYKKILLVMIESLENIMKYTVDNTSQNNLLSDYPPCFYIRKMAQKYILGSSNLIEKNNVPSLKNKLDHLNTLDNQGLKELYKTTITNGQFSQKGGAGLGFIEIVKISSHGIDYTFDPVDELLSYFKFNITIE